MKSDKVNVPEAYKIERLKRICSGCQKDFKSGDRLYSAVVEPEPEQFARQDFCAACWPRRSAQVFSFWEVVYPRREKPRIQDMEKVQKFFDRIVARADGPQHEGVKFFTALVLLRKKRVKLTGTKTTDAGAVLRFEKSWDGEVVEILDPGITEEKLVAIRQQMEQLFEMELQAAPSAAA